MTPPLSEEALSAIVARDKATEGGLSGADYECAADRHALLVEVRRLRDVVTRLASGRPTSTVL